MMHLARELCGGQICITPDAAMFEHPDAGPWLAKFYTINERWQAEDRRKLLAFARDLLNSDYAGHRLTFQLFAQSAPLRPPRRGLPQLRLGRAARLRPPLRRPLGSRDRRPRRPGRLRRADGNIGTPCHLGLDATLLVEDLRFGKGNLR